MALAAMLTLTPASAQAVSTGLEVQVNPIPPGGRDLLLYPGGQYLRLVPPLLHPAEAPAIRGGGAAARAPAAPRVASAAPAPAPKPAPPPPPRVASAPPPPPAATAKPPAAPATTSSSSSSVLGTLPTISMAPPPKPEAKPPQEDTGGVASTAGLAKQGVILFAKDAGEPSESSLDAIRLLAGQLNGALTRPQSRVELMAYGGAKGDRSSDARRLTLRRALAIRQILIDAGVSSTRINVHAQGGADDSGPADRVDVYIRA